MKDTNYEEIYNLVEFAVDDAIVAYDIDERPVIDKDKLKEIVVEIISKRERALKKRFTKEINESVKNILENN